MTNSLQLDFAQRAPRPQLDLCGEPFHEWTQPDKTLWASFYRTAAGYLVRFPALADFEISLDGANVVCWPTDGTTAGSIQHLFLNQVTPLALSRQGRLMLHASAVAVDDYCVAFLGMSGRGKSTLAASFAASGMPFLTDDGLSIEWDGQQYVVLPSHPSVRLWQDSQLALLGADTTQAPPVQFTSKARFLAGDLLPFCAERRELRRVYFLGTGSAPAPCFERLSPGASVIELVKHSFLLDIDEQAALASHFDALTELARQLAFYRLDYPRRFDALPAVRSAIVQHASTASLRTEESVA